MPDAGVARRAWLAAGAGWAGLTGLTSPGLAQAGPACGLPGAADPASGPAALVLRPWPPRQPAPALVLPRWDGADWSLAAQRGHPLLLNFWASWCEPCREEMPSLQALAERHAVQGLQVVAINFRETDAALARYLEATGLRLPVLRDRDGAAARAFGVRTFPSTVALNRRGQVLSTAVGACDWASPAALRWLAAVL